MNKTILLPFLALLTPALAAAQVTYGSDQSSDDVNFNLDIPTGISSGPLWTGAGAWGIADDDAAGVYYVNDGSTLLTAPFGGGGAAATSLGLMTNAGTTGNAALTGLAFHNGVLYGHKNISVEGIHSVDLVTYEATVLLPFFTTSIDAGGLDVDPATGLLYVSNDSATYADSLGNSGRGIVAVDLMTASETLLYPYPAGETDLDGLAFDPSGSIYLLEDEPAPLHRFDIASMSYDPAPAMNSITGSATFSGGTFANDGNTGLGMAYCTTVPNSTGSAGALSAVGSSAVIDNDVTLQASSLPTNSFGFFIVAMNSGFVANPGGSDGNLCLGSNIGRYVGPGQIQNTGSTGEFSLAINLTTIPTPTGPVSVAPGQTWFFQTWHRDVSMGVATSNFTNGLQVSFL